MDGLHELGHHLQEGLRVLLSECAQLLELRVVHEASEHAGATLTGAWGLRGGLLGAGLGRVRGSVGRLRWDSLRTRIGGVVCTLSKYSMARSGLLKAARIAAWHSSLVKPIATISVMAASYSGPLVIIEPGT